MPIPIAVAQAKRRKSRCQRSVSPIPTRRKIPRGRVVAARRPESGQQPAFAPDREKRCEQQGDKQRLGPTEIRTLIPIEIDNGKCSGDPSTPETVGENDGGDRGGPAHSRRNALAPAGGHGDRGNTIWQSPELFDLEAAKVPFTNRRGNRHIGGVIAEVIDYRKIWGQNRNRAGKNRRRRQAHH